ncbi:MAG TPA: hypothetical protein VFF28_06280 [Candidatus Nanoarchaeia archaeon]|nr:hypothetical protein [Candidatus Nanoarchaeia archaeon]
MLDEKLCRNSELLIKDYKTLLVNSWLEQIFRLRFKAYRAISAIDPTNYPDKKIEDKFDRLPTTWHIVLIKNRVLQGAIRIGLPCEIGLSIEEEFPLSHYFDELKKTPAECYPFIDASRLVVDPDARGMSFGTYLSYTAHRYGLDMIGARYIFSVWNPKFKGSYEVGVRPLGEPKRFVLKEDQGSGNIAEHQAVASCLTRETFSKPEKIDKIDERCYIIRPGKNPVILQEALR